MSAADRELLELAAKAAGYSVRWHENWKCFVHVGPFNITNPPTLAGQRRVWVPLTDDGDALRLAVKLGIDLLFTAEDVAAAALQHMIADNEPTALESWTLSKQVPYAATRRAIVRAAAEIGRAMA